MTYSTLLKYAGIFGAIILLWMALLLSSCSCVTQAELDKLIEKNGNKGIEGFYKENRKLKS